MYIIYVYSFNMYLYNKEGIKFDFAGLSHLLHDLQRLLFLGVYGVFRGFGDVAYTKSIHSLCVIQDCYFQIYSPDH